MKYSGKTKHFIFTTTNRKMNGRHSPSNAQTLSAGSTALRTQQPPPPPDFASVALCLHFVLQFLEAQILSSSVLCLCCSFYLDCLGPDSSSRPYLGVQIDTVSSRKRCLVSPGGAWDLGTPCSQALPCHLCFELCGSLLGHSQVSLSLGAVCSEFAGKWRPPGVTLGSLDALSSIAKP